MSADSHTVCPKCHPDLIGYVGKPNWDGTPNHTIDNAAEELGYDRSVRENIEYYLHAEDGKVKLVFDYRADCWTCGWHFQTLHEEPVKVE